MLMWDKDTKTVTVAVRWQWIVDGTRRDRDFFFLVLSSNSKILGDTPKKMASHQLDVVTETDDVLHVL